MNKNFDELLNRRPFDSSYEMVTSDYTIENIENGRRQVRLKIRLSDLLVLFDLEQMAQICEDHAKKYKETNGFTDNVSQ